MESFARRHLGLDRAAAQAVRSRLGLSPDESLMERALPEPLRSAPPKLGPPLSETAALARLRELAALNDPGRSMIGLGYYRTATPSVIQRCVLENPAWYTAYTPYQPEISQGRLEALFVFQTMVADLTGLPIANASLLDEATAAAEAMTLSHRFARGARPRFVVDVDVFPQVRAVLETRAAPLGIELATFDPAAPAGARDPFAGAAGVYVQYQGASGRLLDLGPVAAAAHAAGALFAVGADPLMLALVQPPGEAGADICVGSTQRFGTPLGFGGPHAAYMSVRADLVRQLPGRLVGLTRDALGDPALRLALVTREQHIRREKATSNICTAQALLAIMAASYAIWHGPSGLAAIARRVHAQAEALREALDGIGHVSPLGGPLFDTVAACVPARAAEVVRRARELGLRFWRQSADLVYLSTDELTSSADLRDAVNAFGGDVDAQDRVVARAAALEAAAQGAPHDAVPSFPAAPTASCAAGPPPRTSAFWTHPVFHRHHTELSLMRYLRSLADKDYAMDRGMIPLGSCTMKLNAATELAALTWPSFADLHPFGDPADAAGTLTLIDELTADLLEITGYDSLSLQPNAGSQGELAGLLAIRGYHAARGEADRTVCLIPVSAHGTNAASAALAGYQVVGVAVDLGGNVSLEDLEAKLEQHAGRVGALMITYPSTHGVFEAGVREVCAAAHAAGAQVYIDGANFNALVGWARAGWFGGDVSHLNLHKTFAAPHGGGGPGVGPVAARAHLAPFLPGHPLGAAGAKAGAVAAAPYGSPLILPISWAYIKMMGADGLRAATEGAVLAANYVARRLGEVFPLLYSGPGGFAAHECLLDLRAFTARTGVTVDDVAKRLVDFGFHAPTMSFPVAGTLMVEPTESEDLAELDRFCDAMLAIAAEAERVAAGEWPIEDSPPRRAPHTAAWVSADQWTMPYPRSLGAYPAGSAAGGGPGGPSGPGARQFGVVRHWPAVARVDAALGDRQLTPTLP
ncbi:MAG: aminomethyl-transferring glycine dehydrogenase [Bifidobacteriaceae bacterium]|jgi:glycine dehydrogenase|nr:aminomethyl-transferring glycine dehydrogenase [Bifidobacteriaceae bacterium]